jgi:dipeptidyl aminopeptidase/acylaminoacyl peptidase
MVVVVAIMLTATNCIHAQKKSLDYADFDRWNTVQNKQISPDGNFISYHLCQGEKDNYFKLKNNEGEIILQYDRGSNGLFTYDSKYALFTISIWQDSLKELKRKKLEEIDLPKDTLGIYSLENRDLLKIPRVKSYKVPEKWSGMIAYQLEEVLKNPMDTTVLLDSLENESTPDSEITPNRPVNEENGYHVVVRNLDNDKQDTIKYVTSYFFSKEGRRLVASTTGQDTTCNALVLSFDFTSGQVDTLFNEYKAKVSQLSISDQGNQVGFVADTDTTKILIRPNKLYHWKNGDTQAKMILSKDKVGKEKMISSYGKIHFSENEQKMFFGLSDMPILQDTTLLEEEIVNVEVWTYNESRMYTVQEAEIKADRERSYTAVYHILENKTVPLASNKYMQLELADEGNSAYALLQSDVPHKLNSQWDGLWASDYAIINTYTGAIKPILNKISGFAALSPTGAYVYGYNRLDSAWFTYRLADDKLIKLTSGKKFYDEKNDSPTASYPYGAAGWTEKDASLLLYDRYDIWEFNPETGGNKKLTNGRNVRKVYRYLKLDPEERNMPVKGKWLFSTFNESSKDAGYYAYTLKSGKGKQLVEGAYVYTPPVKATLKDKIIFSRESFVAFPDVLSSDLSFEKVVKISEANLFQKEYKWGTSELVKWISLDGIALEGLLIKPDDFDPKKKYPLLVNFYEKDSDKLNVHRTPAPGRSTINYSFYTSRGYIIFNPNVHYRIGYPGESAYSCVIPGVTKLIEQGYIDKERIGIQGHSWGGYQAAYLVTKTDIFKAAESGAPVPNMISAYGGIRWETGLSRQFQYEHTQSRLGGTPWEYPSRYIENSPIYFIDKINTPMLIMHNDGDGHVPWYQGIELFVSLRRLGKPSWFLNYNDEPHWPLKRQNRVDFNIRMAQYFDYYLMDKPMPVWMDRGVPAIEKGINQGYDLMDRE